MSPAVATVQRRIVVSPDPLYLTAGQVRERYGCSDMWIRRHIMAHDFPQPVRFGGKTSARRWRLADIEAWERARVAKQGQRQDQKQSKWERAN